VTSNKIAFVVCMISIAALIGCAAPTSIPPKPANLQATDSEYYSMYYTYNQWFPDSYEFLVGYA